MSRSGYIIFLGGLPLFWKSKLINAIAVSTQEAEYYTLSIAMRTLIGIRHVLIELLDFFGLDDLKTTIKCTVWEDNNGARILATNQRITSRTKYYHNKWHHFWWAVNDNLVECLQIDTALQRADYLTKALVKDVFESLRKLVQGW